MDSPYKDSQHWSKDERQAWRRICPDGEHCFLCRHNASTHSCQFAQHLFYEKATEEDVRDPTVPLYRCELPCGGFALVRRINTGPEARVITSVCTACAEGLAVDDVLCYYTTNHIGEVIGIDGGYLGVKGETS